MSSALPNWSNTELKPEVREEENKAKRRLFVLQIVQPGLAGLMDGSVSTLAPVFAAAFATKNTWDAFVVGLAASLGAGISMGFAEALSDDGSWTWYSVDSRPDNRSDDSAGGASATRFRSSSTISMSQQRWRFSSSLSNWQLLRGCVIASWTRRLFRPPCKWHWVACWYSPPGS